MRGCLAQEKGVRSVRLKKAKAVLAALAATAALGGCAAGAGVAHDGDDVITYLEPNWFNNLYPPAAGFYPNGGVVNQIADRLLYQDPDTLELSPWIATALPDINEDATEFTFDIRTDVTYSDGTPLTAQNVVNNFDLYGKGDKERVLNISEQISNYDYGEVIDEDTVRFHFTEPSPGFLQATSSYNAGLLSDATLAFRNEDFAPGNAVNVIGSGPFVISQETLGTDLVLTARDDYDWAPPALEHQGRARIDGIHYRLAAEEAVRSGAIVSGQADIVRSVSPPVEKHLEDRGVQIVSHGTNGMSNQLAMRFDHPLLQDIRVREAIMHGIDRENIVRILLSDSYPLATGPVVSTAQGYKDESAAYTFDPELSKTLLTEAGWVEGPDGIRQRDGERLSLTVNYAIPQPRSREVITMVQEDLRQIGIELHMYPGDRAAQNAAIKDIDKVQIFHTVVGRADYDVIESHLGIKRRNALLNADADGNPIDAELEAMLQEVTSTPDEAGRAAASRAAQDHVTKNAYVLPLFEEPQVYAVAPNIDGFGTEAVARPSFYNVSINHDTKGN